MSGPNRRPAIPVILLTGYLGAGKTSLLNHLLRHPDARIGVIVNDFGDLNIDAGLVVGQVDEPLSISGGCVCCLTDDSELEDALVAMTNPKLRLDAIIVEASGFAEPLTLARMITRMGHHRFHLGGVIDVVDATMYFDTVDTSHLPPLRFAATTLVLVNKLDQVPAVDRDATVEAVRARVHERNPRVIVIGTRHARLDPTLIFDPGAGERGPRRGDSGVGEEPNQPELPIRELLRQAYAEAAADEIGDDETDAETMPHPSRPVGDRHRHRPRRCGCGDGLRRGPPVRGLSSQGHSARAHGNRAAQLRRAGGRPERLRRRGRPTRLEGSVLTRGGR